MMDKEKLQELKKLIYRATGEGRTVREFYQVVGVDPLYMDRLFKDMENNFPHPAILKGIAINSQDKTVTYEMLTRCCGYDLRDLIGIDLSNIRRGQIYYADLGNDIVGSEQGKMRPVMILQNDVGNKYSPTVIVAVITSQLKNLNMPTHVVLGQHNGLDKLSMVSLEQIRTVDKKRLKEYIGTISKEDMKKIDKAIEISMGVYSKTDELIDTLENINEEEASKEVSIFKKLLRYLTKRLINKELQVA